MICNSTAYSPPISAVTLDAAAEPSCAGQSFPLGATVLPDGVNFCVFSRQATRIELLLFENAEAATPAHVIDLDPRTHRTYHYWHAFVPGTGAGQVYAYRAFGPFDPGQGLRFDPSKILLDPYGRAVVVPEGVFPATGEPIRAKRRERDEKRRGRPRRLRLGGRRAAASELCVHRHLRDARCRLHAPPQLGRRRRARGTYAGMIRENPVSPGSRDHRRGIAADLPVRPAGLPAGPDQLLGLCPGLVLRSARRATVRGRTRSARSTSSAIWSRRCTAPASR